MLTLGNSKVPCNWAGHGGMHLKYQEKEIGRWKFGGQQGLRSETLSQKRKNGKKAHKNQVP